tara:strand:- start:1040 stop:1243 length:204 start_codon:yes stop_codon:yes gene_type:complete
MQSQKKPKRIGKKGGKRRKKPKGPDKSMMLKKSKKTLLFVPNLEKDDPQTQAHVSLKEPSIVRLNIR